MSQAREGFLTKQSSSAKTREKPKRAPRCDSKGRERARKRKPEKART